MKPNIKLDVTSVDLAHIINGLYHLKDRYHLAYKECEAKGRDVGFYLKQYENITFLFNQLRAIEKENRENDLLYFD